MSSMSAYLATVFLPAPSFLAISALGTPPAPVSRMSCLASGGTVILSSSWRGPSKETARENLSRGPCP